MLSGKPITELSPGGRCSIVSVPHGRLLDLGLVPGTKVLLVRSAPFGGPIEILARGSALAIGRELATRILVVEDVIK